MSVIIRLQNLPWSANALDIRQHFQGLSIPEGGVHIVGGEVGDAFIAFSTDEDARQAMLTDGGKIKEVKLKLMLSSRTEMQKVIEQARQQSVSLQNLLQMPAPPLIPPAPVAPVLSASNESAKPPERRDSDANSNGSRDKDRKDRKERSRSRDRSRRDRERDRRRRSRSRDRSRRSRRTPERSRERSKDRDRRRSPEKSRSSREGLDPRREKGAGEGVNGANGASRPVPVVPVQPGPVWDVPPGPALVPDKAAVPFVKSPLIAERPPMDAGRVDMDGRRIMGSGPAFGRAAPGDAMQGPFQRDGWNGRPNPERFSGPNDRFGGAPRPGFGAEGNDFDGRDDFLPRGANSNFRGGFRPSGDVRRPFMPTGRLGTGPGTILGPPGTMHSFPRSPAPGERFDAPFPVRTFVEDRFKRAFEPPRLPGLCVEIRNMPLDCGYSEIRKFFHGIFLANNAIKMISDNKGHRVGMAYVKLGNPEAKEQAMTLTGNTIRGSVVEVVHLEDGIFDKAIDWYKPGGPRSDAVDVQPVEPIKEDEHLTCLFLEDLPTYVKEADVHRIFPDFTISDLILMPTNDDRKLFVCYANFERPEVAKSALHSRKRFVIGHMSLRVSLCSIDQFQQAVKAVKESVSSPRKEIRNQPEQEPVIMPVGPRSDCILLEGLPYQTNDRDILDFFSDVALVPLRIHIMLDNFNKPSGDAYCEFVSFEETLRAASKNNTMLGKQEISVRPVARAEMLEALGLAQPDLGPMPNPMHGGPRPFGRNFGGGRPMGILGNGPGPRMPLNMMGRMGHGMMRPMGGPIPNDMPIEGFGKPGCVVALENIPFRAEIEEIVEIFEGFDVTRENVIRRFSDMGLATGDARVSLSSPAEAQRAVYELRGVTIRGRPIFLNML